MKILALTSYGTMGASSRIRTYQYIPYLKNHDIDVTVSPLLDNKYLQNLYLNKTRPLTSVISSYIRRLLILAKSNRYDLVLIEKEILKFFPAIFERLLAFFNIPYVAVYDDAIFHNYDLSSNPIFSVFLKNKIDVVMRNAKCVIAGNEYLGEKALNAGAKKVEIIPSVIDLTKYPLLPKERNTIFTIGWIGSPSTTKYLHLIEEALAEVCAKGQSRVIGIGCDEIGLKEVPLTIKAWQEETEAKEISAFDVGVMPLPDDPWEKGKCGFKLIQYMACGIPVVASPVSVNTKIVKNEVNGYLANTKKEWVSALVKIRENPGLAQKMGLEGRKQVENGYTVQATVQKFADILMNSSRIH